jgi:hypothetical protein
MNQNITMKTGNKGLTVKINLFSINEYLDEFNSQMARLWMRGQITHADTHRVEKFNDAGELISILGCGRECFAPDQPHVSISADGH